MSKPSDYPGFKALQKEWSKKLKDAGFKDIEQTNGELKKTGTERRFERSAPIEREAKATYYELVSQKLSELQAVTNPGRADFFFQTEFTHLDLQILQLHADGLSQAAIGRKLGIKGRSPIYRPLYKWLRRWGLKK